MLIFIENQYSYVEIPCGFDYFFFPRALVHPNYFLFPPSSLFSSKISSKSEAKLAAVPFIEGVL